MLEEVEESIDRLEDHWGSQLRGRELHLQDSLREEEIDQLFSDIKRYRDLLAGRNLILDIQYRTEAFDYTVLWESSGDVTVRGERDSEADPDQLFSQEAARDAIGAIRNNRVADREELNSIVCSLLSSGEVDCSFEYKIAGEDIDRHIEEIANELLEVSYYFKPESVVEAVKDAGFDGAKEYFYSEEAKRLLIARGLDTALVGSEVAVFSPQQLEGEMYHSFTSQESLIYQQLDKARTECAIDYFEERYLPPEHLRLEATSESQFVEKLDALLTPYRLMFCVLGTSNISRATDDGWNVRINGRRVIETTVSIEEQDETLVFVEEGAGSIEVSREAADEFSELLDWIYTTRTTDRISVFRNIVTLYSTTITGAVEEIEEVSESVRSNFQFYIRDSIEEFVGVQQDVSEYVFETHREMADIRRGLANNLNRDLFRVFAFAAITWVGIFTQFTSITSIRRALAVSLMPLCLYLGLGLWTTASLKRQFESIEEGRSQYYSMYENRIDENILKDIKNADGGDTMERQFKYDYWIYYTLFGGLLLLSLYSIIDLLYWHYLVSEIVRTLFTP